jgi:hypothetical protein
MIEVPGLVRDITGVPAGSFFRFEKGFNTLAKAEGLSPTLAAELKASKYAGRLTLLSTGHLLYFLRAIGATVDQKLADDIADHLDAKRPKQFDEELIVPALPALVTPTGKRKRVLVLAARDRFARERAIVRKLVGNFFGVKEGAEDLWPDDSKLPTGYELASISHPQSDEVMGVALSAIESDPFFMSMCVTYEDAVIEFAAAGTGNRDVLGE